MGNAKIKLVLAALLLCGCLAHTGPATQRWVRTELYFGLSKRGGAVVSDADWTKFVNEQITPRFPDGYSVVTAEGRYFQDGKTIVEPSRVVVIFRHVTPEDDGKVTQIAREFARQFEQDAVLRTDEPSGVTFVEK